MRARSAIAMGAKVFGRFLAEVGTKTTAPSGDERRVAEQAKFYTVAIESSGYAFITADLHGVITAWNHGAERLFGFSAADAVGKPVTLIVPEGRRQEVETILDALRRGESIDDFETVRIGHDGVPIDVSLSITPIQTAAGALVGSLAVAHNVRGKKQAEQQFRLAVEACPAGMIMTDQAGRIKLVNGEAERLFGYSRGELIGQPVDILVPTQQRDHHVRLRESFAADPQTRRMAGQRDLLAVRKDGVEFPVEVLLNPMRTGDGLNVLSVVIDISEVKRHERLKDEFVATVSHELRTPLTSIAGSIGLLLGNAAEQSPESTNRLLKIAYNNSQRLVRLINDVLDIEKMESGEMEFDLQCLEVLALVEQELEAARGFAVGYGVQIRLDPASQRAYVRADADRLTQVVTNLLSNAVKFSPAGGEVAVSVEQRGDQVRIAVRDHGPGIPQEFRGRVFEKFAQADAADARLKGGSGLGLSIARRIVSRLGGEIGFADAPGGGTVFHVTLPRLDQEPVRTLSAHRAAP